MAYMWVGNSTQLLKYGTYNNRKWILLNYVASSPNLYQYYFVAKFEVTAYHQGETYSTYSQIMNIRFIF